MSSEGSLRVKSCTQCGGVGVHEEECPFWERLSNEAREEQDVPDHAIHGLDGDDNEDELDHSSPLQDASRKAGKRPISLISEEAIEDDWEMLSSDGDDEEVEPVLPLTPDLRWFFQQYKLDEPSQISICRTHANHLAAMSRVSRGGSTGAKRAGRPKNKK